MKKIIITLTFILSLLLNISFATTTEYIEFSSGEVDDGSIYLDSYEDYLNAIGGVDEQKAYEEEYKNMLLESINYFNNQKPEDVIKARILSVEETKEYYSYDSYGVYKIKYQPLNVQILEGKHEGETYDTTYVLTVDSYENIEVKEVRENQKINVVLIEDEETGEVYVYSTTIDASVDRIGYLITLIIITLVLMGIYLGKEGIKILPQLMLLADIILLIFVPELMEGRSIIWMTIITITSYVIVNTTIKVGLNAKTFPVILSTIAVLVATIIGLIVFNNVSTLSGIIYEITTIIQNFPKGTIDFNILNLAIYILMATIVISDISCNVINTYKDSKKEETRKKIKEYVSEKILTISAVLFITITPKYLYMLVAKYSYVELINSEMLINEIARILFLIISMVLTTEITIILKKMLVEEKENL